MENPKRSMSREELYHLVWSTPMQKLAATYGLSDKGLAKTCNRHLIPVPPRGYWAKIDAGQAVKRTPLRKVENTALHTVHIGIGKVDGPSPYMLEVLANARRDIETENERFSNNGGALDIPLPSPVPKRYSDLEPASADKSATSISDKLAPPVQSFISELRQSKEDREGFVSCRWVKVTPNDIPRVGRLLNSIHNDLARFGFSFDGNGSRVGFSKGGATVDFEIKAPRVRETEVSKSGWKQFTYIHAGRLRLRIYGHAEGIKKEWIDTETKSIEPQTDKIVESFRISHAAQIEWEEHRRKSAERSAHLAFRRKLSQQRAEREEERLSYLRKIADARREADDLRTTIARASSGEDVSDDYRRMIEWAHSRLTLLEEQTSAEVIQAELSEKKLFAMPDALHDPEGDPPPKTGIWD
jgi:hypothetical protein